MSQRKAMLAYFSSFVRKLPILYTTFVYRRSEFADLDTILAIGAAYERQRAVAAAARPGQGLDAVVDLMRAEMSAGRPLALAEFATLGA